jgi:hypothetical protein
METYFLAHIDKFFAVSLIITMAISIRMLLQIFGQRWVTTTAHTATLVFLPLITYVITNLISGNIALSLGMVGALSIVRFRNPVRSPLELSVYFGAITMGIAASVSLTWLVFLGGAVLFATLVLAGIHYFSKYVLNMTFFNTSFSEGNSLSTLELILSEDLDALDESDLLNIKKRSDGGTSYVLVSKNFNDLKRLLSTLKTDARLQSYQLQK